MGKNVRNVKIHRRQWIPAPVDCFDSCRCKEVPWLNVSGRWLEEAGFRAGDQVSITVENNKLTIKNKTSYGDPGD